MIPSSVKRVEKNAFYGCENLSEIILLGVLRSVGSWAFPSNAIFSRPAGYCPEGVLTSNVARGSLVKYQERKCL